MMPNPPIEPTPQRPGRVAGGVSITPEVARIAAELGVEMPITNAVCEVLAGQRSAAAAVDDALMRRDPKAELS